MQIIIENFRFQLIHIFLIHSPLPVNIASQTKPVLPIRYETLTGLRFVENTLTKEGSPAIITFMPRKVTYSRRQTLWKTL